jgi:protein-arginine kinase activator protein McsA
MVCSSCKRQKQELHPKKSRLMPNTNLYLCNDCAKAKMEPRWMIILHGRAHGAAAVADYVKYHRYIGDDILAKELVG